MGCSNAKGVIVVILQTLTIIGVYGITLWKFHVHHGVPGWMKEKLSPLYIILSLLAAIALFILIKMCVYRKFPRGTNW